MDYARQAKAKAEAAAKQAADKASEMGLPTDEAKAAAEKAAEKGRAVAGQAAEKGRAVAEQAADKAGEVAKLGGAKLMDAATAAFEALPDVDKERFLESKNKLVQRANAKKDELMLKGAEMGEQYLDKALEKVKAKVKAGATKDPLMHNWYKAMLGAIIDVVWVDVKISASDAFKKMLLAKEPVDQGTPPCPGGPGWFRAFILFHFIPFDKNIWGMLRDPGWIFLTLVTMIPYFAARTLFFTVLLLCIATSKGGPDEFQLVAFVMKFKGQQFITGGMIAAARGGFECVVAARAWGHEAGI
jgi:hypothetical protein